MYPDVKRMYIKLLYPGVNAYTFLYGSLHVTRNKSTTTKKTKQLLAQTTQARGKHYLSRNVFTVGYPTHRYMLFIRFFYGGIHYIPGKVYDVYVCVAHTYIRKQYTAYTTITIEYVYMCLHVCKMLRVVIL